MATPNPNPGKEDYLEVEIVDGGGDYDFLCVVDTINYRVNKNNDDLRLYDCADPSKDAVHKHTLIDVGETFAISGICATSDLAYQRMRSLRKVDIAANFYWYLGKSTNSGKKLAFSAKVDGWEESKAGGNAVKFSCSLMVQGESVESAL